MKKTNSKEHISELTEEVIRLRKLAYCKSGAFFELTENLMKENENLRQELQKWVEVGNIMVKFLNIKDKHNGTNISSH